MKRRKIGILSMHRIINYGSFMQAWGLKMMIESLGYQVVFVDYHIGRKISLQNIRNGLFYKWLRKKLSFIKPINESKEATAIKSQYGILGLDDRYHYRTKVDVLVIGSDEVFNYIQDGISVGCSPELLGAGNRAGRVISYAASCGNLTLTKLKSRNKVKEFKNHIAKIDSLSVRDKNTYEIIKGLTGIEASINLDPVLLNDFPEASEKIPELGDYILIYGYTDRFTKEEGKCICEYAEKRRKKLYSLGGRQSFCEYNICCPPTEILTYFKNASLVITDTFHGTIFSVITESNMAILVRTGENGNENKLSYLISQLGIDEKRIDNIKMLETVIDKPIDYERIKKLRVNERDKALKYLENELNTEI